MIISHKYKLIFIRTVKTAGSSIEAFLSNLCGEEDIISQFQSEEEESGLASYRPRNHQGLWNPLPEIINNKNYSIDRTIKNLIQRKKYYAHMPASLVKQRTPKTIWDSYYKFCVDRNPWDKTLSHYHMVNKRTKGGITFDDYIDRGHFCFNLHKYTDSNGNILVDRVIKFESLMDELDMVFKKLGVPFKGSLGVRLKSHYREDRRPYKEVFSERQKEIVRSAFRDEIEMHGYQF